MIWRLEGNLQTKDLGLINNYKIKLIIASCATKARELFRQIIDYICFTVLIPFTTTHNSHS